MVFITLWHCLNPQAPQNDWQPVHNLLESAYQEIKTMVEREILGFFRLTFDTRSVSSDHSVAHVLRLGHHLRHRSVILVSTNLI